MRQNLPHVKPTTFSDKLKVYKSSNLIWVFLSFLFHDLWILLSFSLWLPSYLRDFYNITPVKAGSFTAIFVFATTFARILGGYLGDHIPGRRILVVISLAILSILIFLNLNVSLMTSLTVFYIMGVCLGIGNGVIFKLVAEYFPKDTGTVGGMVGQQEDLAVFSSRLFWVR